MTQQRRVVYPRITYDDETYENAIFYGNEFRYAWLPATRHMKDLLAMQARRKMRVVEGRKPAQTWRG